MIPLGPFVLLEPVGRGGMSEVWRGRHRELGIPVAVKVLTAEGARKEHFLAALRNEVRAASGLAHEHIVTVFEHGEIGAETARSSDGRLVAGSPYLAMEWASGGTLSSADKPTDWAALRELLLALLSALAHAHARRVVHRDLKLSNVLVCGPEDQRPGLKLADFGIARPRNVEEDESAPVGGTIGTMAPEQLLGRWLDQGPWTDLYALGCLAFKLATGSAVFGRGTAEEVAHAHLFRPVPPLEARFPVPDGLPGWIESLLEKEPEDRVAVAADAAVMLRDLGEAPVVARVRVGPRPEPADAEPETVVDASADEATIEDAKSSSSGSPASSIPAPRTLRVAPEAGEGQPHAVRRRPVPSVPETWRSGVLGRATSAVLPGTGLGIFGLRTLGLVDRDDERTRLWDALRGVATRRRARVLVLEGVAGYGKSRLAQWLCDQALEVGAAHVLEATHDSMGGPASGLGPMLARALRCPGLTHRHAATQVLRILKGLGELDVGEWAALTELVAPAGPGDAEPDAREPVVRLRSARERHEVVRRHVARLAVGRPVVLWLDDVQWGSDALAFVDHLLDAQERSPSAVLVLATARSEALSERTMERALLERIVARPEVDRIAVGRLPESHWSALVRELLGLEGRLAAEVESRTAGNPMFAVQLVGDWVQRGVLEPTAVGFRLREGARADVPADMQAVWDTRVAELLGRHPVEAARALELAATLGAEVEVDEWRDACAREGLEPPWPLLEEMLDARLARAGSRGPRVSWSFVHATLQASLGQHAVAQGRAAAHHRACAEALSSRKGAVIAERVGRHLLSAGEMQAALSPLLEASRGRTAVGDFSLALELLEARERALLRLGAVPSDARVCEGIVERAHVEVLAGKLDQALERAALAETVARAQGWPRLVARALCTRVRGAQKQGRHAEGEAMASEALALARALHDRELEADSLSQLGIMVLELGRFEEAAAAQEQARLAYEEVGQHVDATRCLYERSDVERRAGKADEALATIRQVLDRAAAEGSRAVQAYAHAMLGEIARDGGDLQSAEREYQRALSLCEAIGTPNAMVCRLNLALVQMTREHWPEARALLGGSCRELERAGWKGLLLCARVELMACHAALGDFAAWDEDAARARQLLPDFAGADSDLAWAATRAAELATAAGEVARARMAWEIARQQWTALGRPDEARRAEEALAGPRAG